MVFLAKATAWRLRCVVTALLGTFVLLAVLGNSAADVIDRGSAAGCGASIWLTIVSVSLKRIGQDMAGRTYGLCRIGPCWLHQGPLGSLESYMHACRT